MASSISTCFISHKYPILKPALLPRSPIHHCRSQNISNIRVRVLAIRAGFDVPAGRIRVGRGVETDRLPSGVRDGVMRAVDSYGGRVTIGDVASQAGLKLDLAERALQALAADTEGFLEMKAMCFMSSQEITGQSWLEDLLE